MPVIDLNASVFREALAALSDAHRPPLEDREDGAYLRYPGSPPLGPVPISMVEPRERLADMDRLGVDIQMIAAPPPTTTWMRRPARPSRGSRTTPCWTSATSIPIASTSSRPFLCRTFRPRSRSWIGSGHTREVAGCRSAHTSTSRISTPPPSTRYDRRRPIRNSRSGSTRISVVSLVRSDWARTASSI
jgi:hypothetical protein